MAQEAMVMLHVLLGIVKWVLFFAVGATFLLPLLVIALVVMFWSRQRAMHVSEEAPEPPVKVRVRHQTAAT